MSKLQGAGPQGSACRRVAPSPRPLCFNERMRTDLILAALLMALPAAAQLPVDLKPFVVHETKPAITHGPYLLSPTETSATIVWLTDTPSHSKVVYGTGGQLTHVAEPHEHGLMPVGTRHAVHITGLEPGRTYQYRAVSTQVVKLLGHHSEKGGSIESPVYSFTTLDRKKAAYSFSAVTDLHGDLGRIGRLMGRIDWKGTEFLACLGDTVSQIESDEMLWSRWLGPVSKALAHTRPMMYVRGNHETRGAAARSLMQHVPIPEGRFYYTRDHGPVHFIVLDTGEDKDDKVPAYSGLNRFREYKEEEYAWFKQHVATDRRVAEAPFRILLMHAPNWGWTDNQSAKWTELANKAGIDLAISGHTHRFAHHEPGAQGNRYHQLVIGPEDFARVDVTAGELKVTVTRGDGSVTEFKIPRRS